MDKPQENYFEYLEDFLSQLSDGIYSKLDVDISLGLKPENLTEKYVQIYSHSYFEKSKEFIKDIIYKHPSGFYIYFSRINYNEISFKVKILYLRESYSEIMMFLKLIEKKQNQK